MLSSDPLLHKPKSIIAAKNILYATIFLGIITLVISKMAGDPAKYPGAPGNFTYTAGLIIPILTFVIIFILTRQIGLGRKWARTVFLVLFILGIILFPFTIVPLFKANMLIGLLSLTQAILQILALKFLFAQESTHWFNSVHETVHPG
jgi:hypothetical protein